MSGLGSRKSALHTLFFPNATMISAVVPPQPIPKPQLPNPAPAQPSAPSSVRERAAAGYFRDLALWLNEPLVAQGIFVQVQADQRPGCLKLTVEFQRTPIRDRLLRFLCHRVWQLNSELIEGIHVVARPVGWQKVLWQQRIKIVTPALKRRKANESLKQAVKHQGSPLPPQIRAQQQRHRPAAQSASQRLKTLRAFVLTGSAVAAFVMGCLLEVMISGPSPSLPAFSAQGDSTPDPTAERLQPSTATETSTAPETEFVPEARTRSTASAPAPSRSAGSPPRLSNRPSVVDTALEPVGVTPHYKVTPVPPNEVTLLFGGDVSLEHLNYEALAQQEGGFFAGVQEFFDADVSLVNLATPLATAATSLDEEFRHRLRPEAAEILTNSGIDIVNLTHSNLMQYGTEGLSETLTSLDSQGLYRVGAGRNAMEARRPEILDVKGKRIAYLSYAMGGNDAAIDTTALRERAGVENETVARELENFKRSTAFQERAGFNAQNMPQIVEDLQAIRDEVDWIVVNFRWVDHLEETPNFVQTNLARLAIDQGADVVVGYHPTVIQGGEIYKGRPIAYSLGDFVFHPDQALRDQDSAVLRVALQEDQMRLDFVPVRIRNSLPKTLDGQEGASVLQRIEQASSQFEQPIQPTMLIDLKHPTPPPVENLDPDSPFASPDGTDLLELEISPEDGLIPDDDAAKDEAPQAEDLPSEEAAEETDAPQGELDSSLEEAEAEASDREPEDQDNPALEPSSDDLTSPDMENETEAPAEASEESMPTFDLREQLNHQLQDWGPKVSPDQREFQPVPQNRSGAPEENLDAQAQPVWRQLLTPPSTSNKAEPLDVAPPATPPADDWNDAVPAVPTPENMAPLPGPAEKADPAATDADVSPSTPVAPDPATPTVVTTPVLPAEAPTEAPAIPGSFNTVPTEKVLSEPKSIPPQAEPLVGPLGAVEAPTVEDVALGAETVAPAGAETALAED